MKIYQVHRVGGMYEDSYDYIVGTYLNKDKAEDHKKAILEKNKDESDKFIQCNKCPIWGLTKRKYNNNPNIITDYCNHSKIKFNRNEIECSNMMSSNWDIYKESVRIEEIDVIE